MSLNLGKANVPINFTEYRTTYQFSRPINLILPYALLLVFSTIFVVIGIVSLHYNGTPATDGGFLQLITSRVGRTKIEELILEHHTSYTCDTIPKELLDLKIRYGELVDNEGVSTGVAGFGTEEETMILRKGEHLG